MPTAPQPPATGPALRELRKQLGMTQLQAAAATGLSKRTIIRYEISSAPVPRKIGMAYLGMSKQGRK